MKLRKIFLYLILMYLISCNSPFNKVKIQKKTLQTVKKIEMLPAFIYENNLDSEISLDYKNLLEIATNEELIEVTHYNNGIVRAFSFKALCQRDSKEIFHILLDHITDNEIIMTFYGDIGTYHKVSDIMIELMNWRNRKRGIDTETTLQKQILDSLILYKSNNLDHTKIHLKIIEPKEKNYKQIKYLAKNNNASAIVALSKYRRLEDLNLIKRAYVTNNTLEFFEAVCNFPHKDFWQILLIFSNKVLSPKILEYLELKFYYQAIASYNNQESIDLLNQILDTHCDNDRKHHLNLIFMALNKNKNEIYDPLRFRLWIEEDKISPYYINYLTKKDSTLAKKLILQNATNLSEIEEANTSLSLDFFDEFGSKDSLIRKILTLSYSIDSVKTNSLINKYILNSDVNQLKPILEVTSKILHHSFITSLFQRFEMEDNPYVLLGIISCLTNYKNTNITKRIFEDSRKKPILNKDWCIIELNKIRSQN